MSDHGKDDRIVRREPQAEGPVRNPAGVGWNRDNTPDPSPNDGSPCPPPEPGGPEVSKVVADAVRIGYDVIARNLNEGRDAADRHHAGRYRLEDAGEDLSQLGQRMLQLSRDLSTTSFDLLGAILRDPNIRDAVARHGSDPAPPPPAAAPTPAAPTPAPAPAPPAGPVEIDCRVRQIGTQREVRATALPLQRPPTLGRLSASLHPLFGGSQPIQRVSFILETNAATGVPWLVATIIVTDDHRPGDYSGSIVDSVSRAPLGAISVSVSA